MKKQHYPNVIQCRECNKVLVSFHRHDFKRCGCKNDTFIDGGSDYLRVGAADMNMIKFLKIIAAPKREQP